jgi:hypothetical protein
MILSGEKKEEYREIKAYWTNRLFNFSGFDPYKKDYTHIKFTNGYSKNRPSFLIRLLNIYEAIGNPKWGAPQDRGVYVLSLRKIVKTNRPEPSG